MGSKYEGMTAAELVSDVRINGLSLDIEDICKAQDIFGNSSVGELDRMANDIGRNNDKGEPDPNGSWSSNRPATRSTFYQILFHIWNWEDAVRFWNLHSDPDTSELRELRSRVRGLGAELREAKEETENARDERERESEARLEAEARIEQLECDLHFAQLTIMELKAKLYDMITEAKA